MNEKWKKIKDLGEWEIDWRDFTMEDLTKAIIRKSDNKAVGPDRIPFEIYKCLEKVNLSWILNLFNEWWKGGVVQDYFKEGKIFVTKFIELGRGGRFQADYTT